MPATSLIGCGPILPRRSAASIARPVSRISDARWPLTGRVLTSRELVLNGLLPHKDTVHNRQRGAWVHIAPAVTRDIREWFEGAGWVKPEDWPAIASSVLDFAVTVQAEEGTLEEACQRFLATGHAKGLQAGMVSPILNAVAPERCMVVNSKVRQVVNHFAGTSLSASLADYPALNARARELAHETALFPEVAADVESTAEDVFDSWCHWLVAKRKFQFKETSVWKVAPGASASQWPQCRDGGYIGVGWKVTGDLTGVSPAEWKPLKKRVLRENSDETDAGLTQAWTFATRIKEGDYIVANRGTSAVVGVGVVVGPYYFVAETSGGGEGPWDAHRFPVEWIDTHTRRVNEGGWKRTFTPIKKKGALDKILSAPIIEEEPDGQQAASQPERHVDQEVGEPRRQPPYSIVQCAVDLNMSTARVEAWKRAIERKKQAVFYGPPGTGKTYVAQALAKHLVADTDGFTELVQFHPAYSYEDFVQGIRPQSVAGRLSYPLVPGRLLDFCDKAGLTKGAPCVLIIDEINRANLARGVQVEPALEPEGGP